jgi:glycosyltransferase involved in cell wall biosynthesis
MRVVVNQLAALGLKTGIGHYTVQLLRCLREQAGQDRIDGFPEGWVRRARDYCGRARPYLEGTGTDLSRPGPSPSRFHSLRSNVLGSLRQFGRSLMAQHFRLVCGLQAYDLYHEPNFIPLPCEQPTIATLHDLSVLLHPEWHPADRAAYFETHFHRGLARCVHFLAISEFGRQEMIHNLGILPERITRTYMGIRPGLGPLSAAQTAQALRDLDLPPRYLLYLGTIEPRKNILLLLRAYCALPGRLRSCWPLLLVGNWGWNTSAVAEYLHREARDRGVIHRGYVAEKHLAAIYNGARALVYPSLYEGFGLPPLEMMACGGAVLASTAGALVETVGSKAHLIDPHNLDGWRTAMVRVLEDDDWWQALRTGVMAVARPYTWDRCAADTLRVYRALCCARESQDSAPDMATARHFRQAG